MRSYSFPLRALLPLLVVALVGAGAPAPTGAAANPAPPTDRLIVTLSPAAGTGPQGAASPDEVAVQLSDDAGARLTYVRPLGEDAHILALAAPRPYAEVAAIADRLAATPEVLSAEPDLVVFATREPSDGGYSSYGWHLKPASGGSYGANLPPAWEITTGAPTIVTAIIDTGGRLEHEDLAGRTPPGNPGFDVISDSTRSNDGDERDPDPSDPGDYVTPGEARPGCPSHYSSWHGTHVAGTVGARANNGKGVAGVVWDAPLLFVRALGKCGGYISDIADGMRWAAGLPVPGLTPNPNPARVLNLSLGGTGSCSAYFQSAVDDAVALGTVVVVAAGNENRSAAEATPGNCANVITVAATARNGNRASYSNYGAAVEIAGPGGDSTVDSLVYSTLDRGLYGPEGDSYAHYQGTSMATPHVAGVAALMLSANPTLSPAEVLNILQGSATPFPPGSSCAGACGAGLVNAGAAVEEAARRVRAVAFQADSSSVAEGQAVTIPVLLNVASSEAVAVPFTVGGSAGAADHNLAAGTLTVAPGATTASLSLQLTDDTLAESDETLVISLGPGARSGLGAVTVHTITIRDNDARPEIALAPAALSFGEQRVGTPSATMAMTISNTGALPLTLSAIAPSPSFSRAGGSCPTSLPATMAAGTSCTVALQFTPTRAGARNGSVVVSSNAGDPKSIVLSGVGTTPALGFGPTRLSFGSQLVGTASPTQTVTLTNPGTAPLRISAITASGDYQVGAGTCATGYPATIAPGASCSLEVGFAPQAGGPRAGAITVTSDVPGGPYGVSLRGEGLAPALALDTASLHFGGQRTGTSAVSRTVTVANEGGAPLTLTGLSLRGAAFERVGGTCPTRFPSTIGAEASCTVRLSFTPPLVGSYVGSLSVTGEAGGTASLALAGEGTSGPARSLQLSPSTLTFADRTLASAAGAQAITISNQGEAAMTVSDISVAGTGFSLAGGSCGAPPIALAPGTTCTAEVNLTGASTGAYSGTLSVASDAPGGSQTTTLEGAVVAGPGTFSAEGLAIEATPTTVAVRFTLTRADPADGAAGIAYSLTADRELANGDLVVASGSVTLGPGEASRELAVTIDRLALYGATAIVLDLDEPTNNKGSAPAATYRVSLPLESYLLYVPASWR